MTHWLAALLTVAILASIAAAAGALLLGHTTAALASFIALAVTAAAIGWVPDDE